VLTGDRVRPSVAPVLRRMRDERGQAAAELVAVVPILLVVVLAVGQLAVAGFALWNAADAARVGARADLVGGDVDRAARSVLPEWLEDGAEVEVGDGVHVKLRAPALLPGVPAIPVGASAELDPTAAGDG
jgi:hypothetical protein